jgi:nucleoside-diphosphate-sugar epimerase
MKVLVTGGNGFLGSALCRRLVARGDQVKVLLRPTADARTLDGLSLERVPGDITHAESLPPALKGVDVVFHLAGIRRSAVREDFLRINGEATRTVAQAMVEAGARRLVFAGSLAASGPSTPARPRVEDDPFCPEEWYGESKAVGEQLAFAFQGRLEVTSIRPCRILGPGDHENLTFFKLVKRGITLKLGGGPRPLSMVDVNDVVDQLLLQADLKVASGQAYFSASDETTTLEALLLDIAKALGVTPRTVYLPPAVLRGLAAGADVVTRVTGRKMPLNKKLARQLLAPGWTCSIAKAKAQLGYQPKVTLTQSIAASAESYLNAGWL